MPQTIKLRTLLPSMTRVARGRLSVMPSVMASLILMLGGSGLIGCGAGRHPGLMSVNPRWERTSDQEVIELLKQQEGALWGVAQGQLLTWNLTSERLHRASTPIPSALKVYDLWVEPLEVKRLNQARERHYQAYLTKLKETPTQAPPTPSKQAQADLIDLDGIEIEGGEPQRTAEVAPAGATDEEVFELDLSDMVIDTTTPEPSEASKVKARPAQLPPPPLKVAWRYQVYLATSKGIYRREVWLDAQWRDLLGDQAWRQLYQGEVTQLASRSSGGAWWVSERGFGWLQRGKVVGRLERARATQIVMKEGGGAWVFLSAPELKGAQLLSIGERIWPDGGEPLALDELSLDALVKQLDPAFEQRPPLCEGRLTQLVGEAQLEERAERKIYALCEPLKEGGRHSLSMHFKGRWWPMSLSLPKGSSALMIASWGEGVALRAADEWWVTREGLLTVSASEGVSQVTSNLTLSDQDQAAEGAPRLYLERLTLEELLPYQGGAWTTGLGPEGEPWLSWARPHQGVVSRVGARGGLRKRFETESFAAYHETRPYSLDHKGTLWVPQVQGASIQGVNDRTWRYTSGPEGRTLGVAHCAHQSLFIVSKKVSQPTPKLSLELWVPGGEAPVASVDWSDALFRVGEPKLGDVACDKEGAIYGALFWGPGWSGSGVGALHIPADRARVEIWGARQGYDGEEELTETPLLPDFTINAVAVSPDRRVYFATNSGLAVIDPPTQASDKKRPLKLLSESSGWVTDFINDVSVGEDGRAWVATDLGLFELDRGLKSRRASLPLRMSAVAVDPNTGLIWVALQDKLYRGDGQIQTWERVKVAGSFPLGTIKRVLPFDPGPDERGAPRTAQVWLATTRGLLRAGAAQR